MWNRTSTVCFWYLYFFFLYYFFLGFFPDVEVQITGDKASVFGIWDRNGTIGNAVCWIGICSAASFFFFKGGGCCLFINEMIYNMYGEYKKLDGCFHVLFLFCILFLIPSWCFQNFWCCIDWTDISFILDLYKEKNGTPMAIECKYSKPFLIRESEYCD